MLEHIKTRISPVSHILCALIPLTWNYSFTGDIPSVTVILFCAFFGLFPDIDTGASLVGRLFPFISHPLERRFGHRTITHSILGSVLFAGFAYLLYSNDWHLITMAYCSHLILDMIVGKGVPLLWPLPHLMYFVQLESQSKAEIVVTVLLGIVLLTPFIRPSATTAVAGIMPGQEVVIPTLAPTPATVKIDIKNVYNIDSEILVQVGDIITRGQVIADLTTHRTLDTKPTKTLRPPTPTSTSSPTATNTPPVPILEITRAYIRLKSAESDYHAALATHSINPLQITRSVINVQVAEATYHAALATATPTPTTTPYPTLDPLDLQQADNRLALAQARYAAAVATPTPNIYTHNLITQYDNDIDEAKACIDKNEPDSEEANVCHDKLAQLEQQRADAIASMQPVEIRPEELAILQLQLNSAELNYQRTIHQLTPDALDIQPTPILTNTNQIQVARWRYELAKADHALLLSEHHQSIPSSPNTSRAHWRWQAAQLEYHEFMLSLTPLPTQPRPTATATAAPTPTPIFIPTLTGGVGDEYTFISQISGEVLAINIVSVDGSAVKIRIIIKVDSADPLFTNPLDTQLTDTNFDLSAIPAHAIEARVTHVRDGDTIDVFFQAGQFAGQEAGVRFIGPDTPETVHPQLGEQCYGKIASQFTKQMLCGNLSGDNCNTSVYLELDSNVGERDKYGRMLAHVWRPDGTLHNLELIAGGYAEWKTYGSDSKYRHLYEPAMTLAQSQQQGMWGACR